MSHSVPAVFLAIVGLVALFQGDAKTDVPALASASVRTRLRGITADIAKAGDADSVARMRVVLEALGDDAKELDRFAATWNKMVAASKSSESARKGVAEKLQREIKPLSDTLRALDESRRVELARWILELDANQSDANELVGNVRDDQGNWVNADQLAWSRAAALAATAATQANHLDITFARSASTNAVAAALGGQWNCVRAASIEIHAPFGFEVIERILRQALRAMAFSNALLHGACEIPKTLKPARFVLVDSNDKFPATMSEAVANKGMTQAERDDVPRLNLRSFVDKRGWRTSRWRTEAEYEALILWDVVDDLLGPNAQPTVRVGHLNRVCLQFLGSSMPIANWRDSSADAQGQTVTERDLARKQQALWRSAQQSLYGCRAWMVRQVEAGRDPSWLSTMLDQDGKIRDELLLKATLVAEFLQEDGTLWKSINGTRNSKVPATAFEGVLGRKLPELEERWRTWLLPQGRRGIVQDLAPTPSAPAIDPGANAVRSALQRVRSLALSDPPPEVEGLEVDVELCRAAQLHASYLAVNPNQQSEWPGAHEEYPDRQGFSPAGALAGFRSVICFGLKPEQAIDAWMGTFYHRLPLLDPGLFGIGVGEEKGVIVLDVESLVVSPWSDHVVVWPTPDAVGIPCRFAPEIPNPVPTEDQNTFGYPITVQLFFRTPENAPRLTMQLTEGSGKTPKTVECYFLSPEEPQFVNLAPQGAWCLIPRAPLATKTRYTVAAEWSGGSKTWNFTTGG